MKTKLFNFLLFATFSYLSYMVCSWLGEPDVTASILFGIFAIGSLFTKPEESENEEDSN